MVPYLLIRPPLCAAGSQTEYAVETDGSGLTNELLADELGMTWRMDLIKYGHRMPGTIDCNLTKEGVEKYRNSPM